MDRVAAATRVCGRRSVCRKYHLARCGHAGMRRAKVFRENIRCSGVCRPDMPHTLRSPPGGFGAATAPPFTATQGLASAAGTRALPPRDPGFTSFPGKRSKTRKAATFSAKKQYEFTAQTVEETFFRPATVSADLPPVGDAENGGGKTNFLKISLPRGLTKQHCAAIIIQGIIRKTV